MRYQLWEAAADGTERHLIARAEMLADAQTMAKAIATTIPPSRKVTVETTQEWHGEFPGSADVNFT